MNPQELQSAVRFGADLLVLVLNNAAYGSEFHKLAIAGLDPAARAEMIVCRSASDCRPRI